MPPTPSSRRPTCWWARTDSGRAPPGDAGDPRQIRPARDVGVPVHREQALAALGLVVAVLEEEPAAGHEMRPRAGDDRADRVEAVDPADERLVRLEPQVALAEVRVARRDVRRVGHDHIEALAA